MFKGTKLFGTNNPEAEAPLLDEIEQRYEKYRLMTDPEQRKQAYHEIDSVSQLAAKYFIPNENDKLMAAIGAEGTNAYTSNDVTCYTEDIPSNEIENWAKIQSDRFQNMVIRGFHTELEAVYEEYNIGLTSDQRKLFATISKMLWPNHPYGLQTTIGTQDHLKNPSITNIKNYFKKWYVPNNVAICMAGDLDMDKTIAILDKYFSGWKPAADVKQPTFAPLPPLTSPKDTTVIGQEAETLWMAWRAKKANELQADTLELMEDVLSNGRAGLFDLDLNQTMKV
jgi:predicted Zn-dependent peptidase